MLLKFAIKDLTLNEFHDYCVEAGVADMTDLTATTVKGYLLMWSCPGFVQPLFGRSPA